MPTRAFLSGLLFSILAAAGCGAMTGLGSSGAHGSTAGATSTVGSGGSTGSATGTTGTGGAGGSTVSTGGATSTGAGGATVGPWTFTSCVWENGGDGGNYPGSIAIAQGATFTVTQQGSTLAVTYVDEYGSNYALTFDQTTSTSAVLAPGGASLDGSFSGLCVFGPGDTELFPAQMTATAGTLDYTSGAVFLTLQGTIAPVGTPPCSVTPTPASMWLVCGEGAGWAPVPPDGGVPQIAPGTYVCGSDVGTYAMAGGLTYNDSESGSGTLEIVKTGSTLTASYTGDTVDGTLTFSGASSTAAYAGPGQTMNTVCDVTTPGPPLEPLPIEASALVVDGTTLYLMLRGTMTTASSCPGALETGVIGCTMQ